MSAFSEFFLMKPDDVKRYAVEVLHRFDPDEETDCTEIGDGNINYVFQVRSRRDGRSVIVKQADKLLRSSGRPLDIYRNKIEAQTLQLESRLAPDYIPEVYHYDETMAALSMEDISAYKNLRKELLAGRVYGHLAENISKPGATNIVIDEALNPDFTITSISMPTKGGATMINQTSLRWTIDQLGVTANEGASLEFWIKHVGNSSGNKLVNQSITYTDSENNQAIFPTPSVMVDCGIVVMPEPCPEPVDITVGRCQDSLVYDAGDVSLESLGRILQLDVNLKSVCPGKRTALGVVLTEIDQEGNEHQRGMKTMTIPAHNSPTCRDVLVKCIKFVLPEDMDVSGENPPAICNARNFKARFIAHYIDSDFRCCELEEPNSSSSAM